MSKFRKLLKYRILLEAMAVGLLTGFVISAMRAMIIVADAIRGRLVAYANSSLAGAIITVVILLILAAVIAILLYIEPDISGSGIPQLEGELRGLDDQCWWRVLPAKLAGCVLSIGGGLSLGREGPSVQLGAMVGKGWSRSIHTGRVEEHLMMTCGAAAGLSAAFGAPLAGAIFALEELHRSFSVRILITAMSAAAVSDYIACEIVGLKPVFDFNLMNALPHRYYGWVVVMGVILGIIGFAYNKIIELMQNAGDRINAAIIRRYGRKSPLAQLPSMLVIFCIAALLVFVYPKALGSGGNLPLEIAGGQMAIGTLMLLFVVKLLYSTASFGSGAPGGIFLPLLVLGALVGGIFSELVTNTAGMSSIYAANFVIIGMAGMFAAIVRAPATGIVLISEMSGGMTSMLALVIVSLAAYITADVLNAQPVYEQLLERRQRKKKQLMVQPKGEESHAV